jgi:hypothetical protein
LSELGELFFYNLKRRSKTRDLEKNLDESLMRNNIRKYTQKQLSFYTRVNLGRNHLWKKKLENAFPKDYLFKKAWEESLPKSKYIVYFINNPKRGKSFKKMNKTFL